MSSDMDFQSVLDYVETVGYDVEFLRGDTRELLDTHPIATGKGSEHFDPRSAPLGALAATGPWAARLIQGGGTFTEELAGETTWSGSLDLPAAARCVSELVRSWMTDEVFREAEYISRAGDDFPVEASAAEQFYSLRDAIQFSEQWLPGTPSSRPALTVLFAFCIGVDEFFCPLQSLDTTRYLGRLVGDLWAECLAECGGSDDAAGWLELARDALRSSVFLQNREKLAYVGVVEHEKQVFTDWDTTAHYMLRAEAAMTPFVGLCLCAYAGLPFRPDLAGAVGIYCYGNAFVLDFCKRATRLGGGNYTEIALSVRSGELQGRSHLIGSILAYGESVLPSLFLCVLRPYIISTSSVVDVLDRYRERSWGLRLPVGQATLWMMEVVMEGVGASMDMPLPPTASSPYTELAAEVTEASDAWDIYHSYAAQPSVDGWYRLPRPVQLALQLQLDGPRLSATGDGNSKVIGNSKMNGNSNVNGSSHVSTHADSTAALSPPLSPTTSHAMPWMKCLYSALPPPTPPAPSLTPRTATRTSRLPPIRKMERTGLDMVIVHSPARPGGYASGQREFIGRPAGAGPALA